MIANSDNGEIILKIGDSDYILRYDYKAIAMLNEEFGKPYEAGLSKMCIEKDVMSLAKAVEIGLQRFHKDSLSLDEIVDLSPPLIPVINAINKAHNLAQFGNAEGLPEDENPTMLDRIKIAWKILFSKRKILHIIME